MGNNNCIEMDNFRKLSPCVSLVGVLCSYRFNYAKYARCGVNLGHVVGYRFKTTEDIQNIIKFDIENASKACGTDPSGYRRNNIINVRSGECFDLNMLETMSFFMRDDICGLITGGDFDICLSIKNTDAGHVKASLAPSNFRDNIMENKIYIDKKVDDEVVPVDGFNQYAILYEKIPDKIKVEGIDIQAKTILNLRDSIDPDLWSL